MSPWRSAAWAAALVLAAAGPASAAGGAELATSPGELLVLDGDDLTFPSTGTDGTNDAAAAGSDPDGQPPDPDAELRIE